MSNYSCTDWITNSCYYHHLISRIYRHHRDYSVRNLLLDMPMVNIFTYSMCCFDLILYLQIFYFSLYLKSRETDRQNLSSLSHFCPGHIKLKPGDQSLFTIEWRESWETLRKLPALDWPSSCCHNHLVKQTNK